MLKDNGFQKVKLFDAHYDTLKGLGNSGIEVMVGIPNDVLATLGSFKAAEKWVSNNISVHLSDNNENIRTTFPALQNVQAALVKAGQGNQVKVTVPLNADVYESSSSLPSGGGKGTPMRPVPVYAYLFSLIDEDAKSIQPGNFKRHWGILPYDGRPKYSLNLGTTNSGSLIPASVVKYLEKKWCVLKPNAKLDNPEVAPSVSYACARGDCTSLGYETSCGGLDARENISYAFNSYYQIKQSG
ncbi:hypothetical protein RDI58_018075 [Solanum bulbocastanum]|uniref:X8 domain-containing protein n=1 Tax=Solanum bulbocastanum TaxID=147425 RepID=A0AAN8TCF3_SOLBU